MGVVVAEVDCAVHFFFDVLCDVVCEGAFSSSFFSCDCEGVVSVVSHVFTDSSEVCLYFLHCVGICFRVYMNMMVLAVKAMREFVVGLRRVMYSIRMMYSRSNIFFIVLRCFWGIVCFISLLEIILRLHVFFRLRSPLLLLAGIVS